MTAMAEEATRVAGTDGKESNGGDGRDKLKVGISNQWAEWMILVSDDWELPFSARQPAPAPAVRAEQVSTVKCVVGERCR